MRQEDIANAFNLSVPTLRKHYAAELSTGAAKQRMAVLEKVLVQAKKGSTSAARLYLSQTPEFDPAPLEDEKSDRKGKKAQAQEDAVTAADGTSWSGLLPSASVTPIRKNSV